MHGVTLHKIQHIQDRESFTICVSLTVCRCTKFASTTEDDLYVYITTAHQVRRFCHLLLKLLHLGCIIHVFDF